MTMSKAEQKREHKNKLQRERRARDRQQAPSLTKTHSRPHPADNEKLYTKQEVKDLMLQFARENLPEPEPPKLSRSERRWERKKEKLRQQLAEMTDEPPEEYTMTKPEFRRAQTNSGSSCEHPVTIEETRQQLEDDGKKFIQIQSHFKGKKPLQFKPDEPAEPVETKPAPASTPSDEGPIPTRKKLRFRRKAKEVFTEQVPEALPPSVPDEPDVVEEQVEKPQTTKHCPESIKEDGLKEVKRNPEYYIEINMVTKSRVVDTFYIPSDKKKFHYKKKEYDVNEEAIYLLPTKLGLFMPTCHYKEGTVNPQGFKQTNRGITGKALSLLYMEQLYTSLLYSEDVKYNFFIVILIAYGIGCYFLFVHNGGLLPKEGIPLPNLGLIHWRI